MAKKKTTEVVEEVPKVEATLVEKDGNTEHYEADVIEVIPKMKSVKSPTRGGDLVVAEVPSNCLVADKSYSYIWFNTKLSIERVCEIIEETLKNGQELAPASLEIGIQIQDPEAILTIGYDSEDNAYIIRFDGESRSGAYIHKPLFDSIDGGWNDENISQFEDMCYQGFTSYINQANYPESFQELLGATIKGPYYPLVKDKNYSYIWLNTNLSNESVNEIIYNIVSQSSEAIVEEGIHKVEILSVSGGDTTIKIYLGYVDGKGEPDVYFIGNYTGSDIGDNYLYCYDIALGSEQYGWKGSGIFNLFDSISFFPIIVLITSSINENDYPDMIQLLGAIENYSGSKNPSNFKFIQKGNKVYMTIGDGRIRIPWDKRFVDANKGESIEIIPAKLTIKGYYRSNTGTQEYDPVTPPIVADEDGNVTLPEYPDFGEFNRVTKGYSFDKNAKEEDLLHEGDIVNIKDDAVIYNVIIQIYL